MSIIKFFFSPTEIILSLVLAEPRTFDKLKEAICQEIILITMALLKIKKKADFS